jgi:hypothetical protein
VKLTVLSLLTICALGGCTIRIEPIPAKQAAKGGARVNRASAIPPRKRANGTRIVDADWMENYRILEEKANHTIPQDAMIKAVDDKFRVPVEVINHHGDLLRAEPVSPSPQAQPTPKPKATPNELNPI